MKSVKSSKMKGPWILLVVIALIGVMKDLGVPLGNSAMD
jgi:hypothetical protein